jgi:hypothetical protein
MADGSEVQVSANAIIETLIDQYAAELEGILAADVIFLKGPIVRPLDQWLKDALEERKTKQDKLALFLETDGGFADISLRMVDAMRHHYPNNVEFVIPNYAYSAGTLLALSGNEIHMNYFSVLGPIDPQVETPSGRLVPALGYIERYEDLVEKSKAGTLTTAEMALMIQGFDQGQLAMFTHERELGKALLKDWLPRYKFRDWNKPEADKVKRAEEIADELSNTKRWHSHSRGLSMQVLMNDPKLKLKIKDFGQDEKLNKAVTQYARLLDDYAMRIGAEFYIHSVERFVK